MKIGWISDPHLGIERVANTTLESRRRFKKVIFLRTLAALERLRDLDCDLIYLAGDLVDTYANDERTIAQAYCVCKMLTGVLGGNHDFKNDMETTGTLQLLQAIFEDLEKDGALTPDIIADPINEASCREFRMPDDTKLVFISHKMTQELFEQSLVKAAHHAHGHDGMKVLVLHCNVGEHGFKELTKEGTSLYLTQEMREEVEKYFDYVLVGHEHHPGAASDKTIILGNVMPLTFGEMGDRHVYILDTDDKRLYRETIFSAFDEHVTLEAKEVLEGNGAQMVHTRMFVDIQGTLPASDLAAFTRALANFWKNNNGTLLVRNGVKFMTAEAASKQEATFIPKTLPELVGEAVQETEYADSYREAVAAVEEDAAARPAPKGGLSL